MNHPVLVIMAAGLGSRYGGLKQIDPIGPDDTTILEHSVYDAIKAGFETIYFIIQPSMEHAFESQFGKRFPHEIHIEYIHQTNAFPFHLSAIPRQRTKPLGTGHAILCCKDAVTAPFAVINADDFYGADSFLKMYRYLSHVDPSSSEYAMVGYALKNTLTENGTVSRGICEVDQNQKLLFITERTQIQSINTIPQYTEDNGISWKTLSNNSIASMNFWGFTPKIFDQLMSTFRSFVTTTLPKEPLSKEFFLPEAISQLLIKKQISVTVLSTDSQWYGVTYAEDRKQVQNALLKLHYNGNYPSPLW
jgi:NDP-sugar pyrophosphorylase family protein